MKYECGQRIIIRCLQNGYAYSANKYMPSRIIAINSNNAYLVLVEIGWKISKFPDEIMANVANNNINPELISDINPYWDAQVWWLSSYNINRYVLKK